MVEIIEGVNEQIYEQSVALWLQLGLTHARRGDNLAMVEQTRDNGGRFYTARAGEQVVGTCWITTDARRVYIHHMGVHPDHQNQGIGRMLLEIAVAYGDKLGQQCKLEVHRDNEPARHLYESLGFEYIDGYEVMIRRDC